MAIVNQPCYCTREMVRRALDVKQASYTNEQVDRAICAAADAVEDLTQRKFYPLDTTRKWDWPNFQYSYPWRVWFDNFELAAIPTQVVSGSLLPTPVNIPINAIIFQPVNEGPPYTRMELRRDLPYSFGNNTTPQLDIAITGTFGYWMRTRAAGAVASTINAGDPTINVTDGYNVGVGDVAIIDSERMIVNDATYTATAYTFLTGITGASAADNVGTVTDGTKFTIGETIMVDTEWMLILNIIGNTITVKRAWDASILQTHSGGTIYAKRLLSVLRGQLGTTAASHSTSAPIVVNDIPGLVRELAIAEAEVWVSQEPTAYGGAAAPQKPIALGRGGYSVSEPVAGAGIPDIRQRVENSRFTRKARSRVI